MGSKHLMTSSILFIVLPFTAQVFGLVYSDLMAKSKNPEFPEHCEAKFESGSQYYTVGTHQVPNDCMDVRCDEEFALTYYE